MKELKFKAWDNKEQFMVEPFTYGCDSKSKDGYTIYAESLIPSERFSFMQFTGMFDKNGKEIYDGDIINTENSGIYSEVEWCRGAGAWVIVEYFVNHPYTFLSTFDETDIEIVGNIFETPELLSTKSRVL